MMDDLTKLAREEAVRLYEEAVPHRVATKLPRSNIYVGTRDMDDVPTTIHINRRLAPGGSLKRAPGRVVLMVNQRLSGEDHATVRREVRRALAHVVDWADPDTASGVWSSSVHGDGWAKWMRAFSGRVGGDGA